MADPLRDAVRANSRLRMRHAAAVESASAGITKLAEKLADANAEIERLTAEVQRLRADAARLDWFADHIISIEDDCRMASTWCVDSDRGIFRGDTIRAAIDAAMGKEGTS